MKINTPSVAMCLAVFAVAFFIIGCNNTPTTPTPSDLWEKSGHADATAAAFSHWDKEIPPEIPAACAKCHSETGFLDFVGADGTDTGVVNSFTPTGTVVSCVVCHVENTGPSLRNVTSVDFPSGVTIANLSHEAICMTCHQGVASSKTVKNLLEASNVRDDDTISEDLHFIDGHYMAAGAIQYGTLVQGGYEYDNKSYDAKFDHAGSGLNTCSDCHNSHSLKIKFESCGLCHKGIGSEDDLKSIRYNGSMVDYDGDGNITEGMYYEVRGMQGILYRAIQAYCRELTGTAIVYDSHSDPFFFIDKNGNGVADKKEKHQDNAYNAWTGRLIKAAYNYHFSMGDAGAFAHNGKYVIELLFDSINDLNWKLTAPIMTGDMHRTDGAHLNGSAKAFRTWDEPGVVPANCSKCHSTEGLPKFLANGGTYEEPISNGFACSTCHKMDFSGLREVDDVTLSSGIHVTMADSSNLCIHCHQAIQSKTSLDNILAKGVAPYTFVDIHYAVDAIFFGTEAKGLYEYSGKTYTGKLSFPLEHSGKYETCVQCHMISSHDTSDMDCAMCHANGMVGFRPNGVPDYDGDGNTSEGLKDEIEGLKNLLYYRIQSYAKGNIAKPIVYANTKPYFFNDINGDGFATADETIYSNEYKDFDAELLKAAYNYHACQKEPAAYVHNALYVAQILVDSIESLMGDVSPFTWR
jgi:hypothetical protein